MDAETLERLFQPFVQADQSLDRAKGGLGLGLALVKGLVEMHGGRVTARSEGPGKGSTFEIRLALLGEKMAAPRPAPPAAQAASRRVLVIEDNLDAARSLSDALELCGHHVAVASTGQEGLARAHQFRPEVVLCDIGLPGMDGYEVARAFAADERLRGTYLVALTGYALPEDVRRASEAGFRQHIAKPPSLEQLEQLLATAPSAAPVRPPAEER
jgi:CheY-like chemotaxis protein